MTELKRLCLPLIPLSVTGNKFETYLTFQSQTALASLSGEASMPPRAAFHGDRVPVRVCVPVGAWGWAALFQLHCGPSTDRPGSWVLGQLPAFLSQGAPASETNPRVEPPWLTACSLKRGLGNTAVGTGRTRPPGTSSWVCALAPLSWPGNGDGLLDLWPHRSCPSRGPPAGGLRAGTNMPRARCCVLAHTWYRGIVCTDKLTKVPH